MAAVVDNLSMAAVVVFIIFAAWFHWMVDNVYSEKEAVFRLLAYSATLICFEMLFMKIRNDEKDNGNKS